MALPEAIVELGDVAEGCMHPGQISMPGRHIVRVPDGGICQHAKFTLQKGSKGPDTGLTCEVRGDTFTSDILAEALHESPGKASAGVVPTQHSTQERAALLGSHGLIVVEPPANGLGEGAAVEFTLKERRHTRRRALK